MKGPEDVHVTPNDGGHRTVDSRRHRIALKGTPYTGLAQVPDKPVETFADHAIVSPCPQWTHCKYGVLWRRRRTSRRKSEVGLEIGTEYKDRTICSLQSALLSDCSAHHTPVLASKA